VRGDVSMALDRGALMTRIRVFVLTLVAMLAFAGNSLLCRQALRHTAIDPASFTLVRIASGALILWLLTSLGRGRARPQGDWGSALALIVYAGAFSFAYVGLTAGTGALLLFGAVQVTMIGAAYWRGERLRGVQSAGLLLAIGGVVGLLAPGLSAPPLRGALLMLGAGVAWGIYSLRGRRAGDPLAATAGNFLRAIVPAGVLSLAMLPHASLDRSGVICAVASGALASGVGYAIWYAALPQLRLASASVAQLSVPMIAALAAVTLLGEALTTRLEITALAILGGIALVVLKPRRA
jgi:drug/metabolite transporter (DMT)-like permease